MELPWIVFLLLAQVALAALSGFVSSWLLRKRSSESSAERSEGLREEWKAFKRSMLTEWEDLHHRMRSMAGRMDRAKKKSNGEEPPPEKEVREESVVDIADINRQLLRSRGVPL